MGNKIFTIIEILSIICITIVAAMAAGLFVPSRRRHNTWILNGIKPLILNTGNRSTVLVMGINKRGKGSWI